jgi:WD40 repeat protein
MSFQGLGQIVIAPIRTTVEDSVTVSSRVVAIETQTGLPSALSAGSLVVRELGVTLQSSVSCDTVTGGRNVSLLVAVDLSNSMDVALPSGQIPKAIANAAAVSAVNLLKQTSDEIGLVGVGARSELLYGLSTDKAEFATALSRIQATGGFNLRRGFSDIPTGALTHLQNARNSRALLIITDGSSRFDLASTLAIVKTFAIRVYVIGIGVDVSPDLRRLADSSGGGVAGLVTTSAEASIWASAFASDAKVFRSCKVTWKVAEACTKQRVAEVSYDGQRRSISYQYPDMFVSRVVSNRVGIDMGILQPGESKQETVVFTARQAPVTVSSIDLSGDDSFQLVNGPTLPITLVPGQALPITIEHTSQTIGATYATVRLNTDACMEDSVIIRAGSVYEGQTLQLVEPRGGSVFLAGRDTIVRWNNALPDEYMRLEVSYDNGVTWSVITDVARNLEYRWTPGPGVGERCQMRISNTVIDQRGIVRLAGQTQPVYSAVFSPDDKMVLTGGDDGSVRAWDAKTGQQQRIVGIHGNWVWGVAVVPGTSYVASASHDGTVRVWDYSDGSRVATVNVDSRAWSLVFSSDGASMFIGTDNRIYRVSTSTWNIESSTTAASGPVYDLYYDASHSALLSAEGPSVIVRDSARLDILRQFGDPDQKGPVFAVTMPSAGDVVVTGGADFVLRKYQYSTGAIVQKATPSVGSILSLSYSSDDSRILSSGSDGTAKIYLADNLQQVSTLAGHEGIVYSSVFSNSGSSVVTASTDFTARVWPLDRIGKISSSSNGVFTIRGGTGTPVNVNFGDVVVGSGADRPAILLLNNDTDTLVVRSLNVRQAGTTDDFEFGSLRYPFVVAPGKPYAIDVSFIPAQAGERTVTIDIETGRGSIPVTVSGRGVLPGLNTPEILDFGRQIANQNVVDSVVTVLARGDAGTVYDVTITQILGAQSSMYSIVEGGAPFTLRGGESRKIKVRFDPRSFGRFSADLVLQIRGTSAQKIRLYGEATGEGRISANTALLYPSQPCRIETTTRTVAIRNIGNSQTVIYSAGIEGLDADEFTIRSQPSYPFTLNVRDSVQISVEFNPKRVSIKDARLVVTSNASNALNGRTVVNIAARRDSVGFELSRTQVRFDNLSEGQLRSERVFLFNTGTLSLQWPRAGIALGRFRIDSITPDITTGRKSSSFVVSFLGGKAGMTYDTSYTFVDTTCGREQTIRFVATVKSYIGAHVRVGRVAANVGEVVSVPVYVTNAVNLNRTAVRQATAHLRVNSSVLTPSAGTPAGTLFPNGVRQLSVNVPLDSKDSIATLLTFQVTWGDDSSSLIVIDSITTTDTLQFTQESGEVIVKDLCRIGGRPRLVRFRTNGVSIAVWPSPAQDQAVVALDVVEPGQTSIRLFNALGECVETLLSGSITPGRWQIPIDLSSMNSGSYFIVLKTPTETSSHRFEVTR